MMAASGKGYGMAMYLQMVTVTGTATAAVAMVVAAGPLGLLFGLPFALTGLAIGLPLAALVGTPVWIAIWRVGLGLRWRPDAIAVLAAFLIGLIWIAATKCIDMQLPYNQPHGSDEPIHLPGRLEVVWGAMTRSSHIALLIAPFVAMRLYGGARD